MCTSVDEVGSLNAWLQNLESLMDPPSDSKQVGWALIARKYGSGADNQGV